MGHPFRAFFNVFAPPGSAGAFRVSAAVNEAYRTLGAGDDGESFNVSVIDGDNWEVRTGCVYTHSSRTLSRGTLDASSTGAAINFSAGAKVMCEGLSASQVESLGTDYDDQDYVWYSGEISSVQTPTLKADGDLSTATDQVPQKWRIVIEPDDDIEAAQRLKDNGPNIIEILLGGQEQRKVKDKDGLPKIVTKAYAVCVSNSTVPADYTGGTYIVSAADTNLANWIAAMARVDFSAGLGATALRLLASPVYTTNYSDLSMSAGVAV